MTYKITYTKQMGDKYFGRCHYEQIVKEVDENKLPFERLVKAIQNYLRKDRLLCGRLMFYAFLECPDGIIYRITEDSIEIKPIFMKTKQVYL